MPDATGPASLEDAFRISAEDVAAGLGSHRDRGLDDDEAARRLKKFGLNELEAEKAEPAWRRFLAQFQDTLVLLLLAATLVSAVLWFVERDTALPYEALAIFTIVLLNATLGFVQERRAAAAVAALNAMAAAGATVVRGGLRHSVPAAEVVPGDLIVVSEGDTIPADARLVDAVSLQTAEASLTGESLPVSKDTEAIAGDAAIGDRHNMVYSGTSVTYGHGLALVTETGMRTEMGRIAGMLAESTEERTPLQAELDRVGRLLGVIVLAIAVVMAATIVITEHVRSASAFVDVLIFAVALAVAAVPEGLPAVVTAVLSLGVQRMSRRNAIVRHLAAVETLGSASVVASDKTGTLTRNEMTVRTVVTASGRVSFGGTGYAPEGEVTVEDGAMDGALGTELTRTLAAADRANNASVSLEDGKWEVQGDPTEAALLVAARKTGLHTESLDRKMPRVAEVPFSSERKLMSTVNRIVEEDRLIVFTKGAADVVLARCTHEMTGSDSRSLTPERRNEIQLLNDELAGNALRTLGVAFHRLPHGVDEPDDSEKLQDTLERDLVFAGLVGMIDPPRTEAAEAVRRARAAGIRPIMITGDHPLTASVIATELGIADAGGDAVTGAMLDEVADEELPDVTRRVSVYARVNPEHKLRIVRSLKSAGHVVAMTGDGVNDAPALKTADIGVAMGITGTDVSREASDIVLADDNFATIIDAVEEGRSIFSNIRKFLRFLLSSNVGEVLTMFLGVVLAGVIGLEQAGSGLVLPLLATQILWINLVTDGAPALALGIDPAEHGLMEQPPRPAGERVITAEMWRGIIFVAVVMAVGTLGVLDASLPGGLIPGSGTLRYAQTMAFTTLMLFQMFNVLNSRSDSTSAFIHLFSNRWLWAAIGLSLLLQAVVIYLPALQAPFGTVPLAARDVLVCFAVASSVLWLREAGKFITRLRTPR
ncbi:MAG TPA: cation-translocating P-type ATPase [Gemmatimonadales bacterium]|nr:cation-translocating P-type ATPase [Gemmatimonadales bacterium]